MSDKLINLQSALDAFDLRDDAFLSVAVIKAKLMKLPGVQAEKDIPKRVLWSGWKGTRDTRYKCANCKKPVRNDDHYCHRCGQRLIFPRISHTAYIPGEKQQLIVRWDDE